MKLFVPLPMDSKMESVGNFFLPAIFKLRVEVRVPWNK